MKKITTLLKSQFRSAILYSICIGAFCLLTFSSLQAQSGVLKGLILDTGSGSVMPGAEVVLVEKSRIAFTDVNGIFSFGRVEPALYTLRVRYLGYKADTIKVNLADSTAEDITIYMVPDALTTEEVVISSQALGQTKAINQQLNSDAIANIVSADRIQELPDVNAAEAIARLPGIAINRNGGEGQKIVIRGLEPKFASININGVSLPSNASTDRSVDLSLISPELLDGIEVFKSPLPDMDAEAVGGSVNLKLRKAPKRFRLLVKGLGGYNELNDDFRDYKGIFQISNRVLNDKVGIVYQAGLERFNRGVDIITNSWRQGRTDSLGNTEILGNALRLEDRSEIRKRLNSSLGLDYSIGANQFSAFGLFSRTSRDQFSMRQSIEPGNARLAYRARDFESQLDLFLVTVSGEHKLKNLSIDWALSDSRSQGSTPSLFSMDFRQNNDAFALGVNGDANPETFLEFIQPNLAQTILVGNQARSTETLEDNQTANLNFELPIKLSDKVNLTLKAGGKYKNISRNRMEDEYAENFYYLGSREIKTAVERYDGPLDFLPQNPALVNAQSFSTNSNEIEFRDFRGDNIGLDLSIDSDLMRDWYDAQRDILTKSREPLINNYEVTERVSAAYAMAKLKIGEVLTIIPGFRYEYSNNDYSSGLSTINGRYGVNGFFRDTSVNVKYGQFLPHLHAKYEPTEWLDVRFSYSTTMARPDFNFITPRFQINDNSAFITAGNPDLRHAVSTNYDLSVSAYKGGYGLISAGVFYKNIDNLFYPWRTFLVDDSTAQVFGFPDNRSYDYQSYVNSDNGFAYGFEFDFQTNLSFLPKPFSGLVVNVNYTRLFSQTEVFFLTSETRLIRPRPPIFETIYTTSAREVNLLSQAPHIFRASLGYDYKKFSFRVSAAYQGTKPNSYSINKDFDTFVQEFWRWDASIKQGFGDKWSLFINLNNFGNQRDVSFTRNPNFTNSVQTFGVTGNMGLQYQIR